MPSFKQARGWMPRMQTPATSSNGRCLALKFDDEARARAPVSHTPAPLLFSRLPPLELIPESPNAMIRQAFSELPVVMSPISGQRRAHQCFMAPCVLAPWLTVRDRACTLADCPGPVVPMLAASPRDFFTSDDFDKFVSHFDGAFSKDWYWPCIVVFGRGGRNEVKRGEMGDRNFL